MNHKLNTLEEMLARHDWHYEYSDDHSVWTQGRDQRAAINTEQKRLIHEVKIPVEEVTALTDLYRPKNR